MNWDSGVRPLVIGHRGAGAYLPDNTLAACALAVEQGADGIEVDVQMSADGRLVLFHDFNVKNTTNGDGKVTQMTLTELKALDLGEGQRIPTLDDLLEMLGPSTLYNLEIKDFSISDRGVETAVADRVESHNLQEHVLISSFNPFAVRRARRVFSNRTKVALIRAPGLLKYGYWLAQGEADHPYHAQVHEKYMAWAKRRGFQQVNVWTVDDPAEACRLADLGVNAIVTNKPDVIVQALREHSS